MTKNLNLNGLYTYTPNSRSGGYSIEIADPTTWKGSMLTIKSQKPEKGGSCTLVSLDPEGWSKSLLLYCLDGSHALLS